MSIHFNQDWLYTVKFPFNCHTVKHYENTPMQIHRTFYACKNGNLQWKNVDIFLIFAQNIDCGYILTSTHKLCFGANIRKIGKPCISQFCYIIVGFKGVYFSRTLFEM